MAEDRGGLALVALVALVAFAGCLGPTMTTCADGTTCPSAKVCAPAGGSCVDPEQVKACVGKPESANCAAVPFGVCQSGVCDQTAWQATPVVGGDTPATAVGLTSPVGVAVDRFGNVYLADRDNHRVLRLDAGTSIISAVAGIGTSGFTGDGGAAPAAQLDKPSGVAVDGLGNLFIADTNNHRIRRVDAGSGIITTVAGTGIQGCVPAGLPCFGGDGGAATRAQLDSPSAVVVDGLGTLYIADTNNERIRRVDAGTQVITTVAGDGTRCASSTQPCGDGGPAVNAQLYGPQGIAFDGLGNLYIADTQNHRIRRVDTGGTITASVGTGTCCDFGDGGAATSAWLDQPLGVTVDGLGNLFLTDNDRVRRVDATTGVITAWAGLIGGAAFGFTGDGGLATAARLYGPSGVAVDGLGNLFVADTSNHRIRRVDATTTVITTVAGSGTLGLSGDGGAATSARLSPPEAVTVDGLGNIYIATQDSRICRVDRGTGVISTVAGTGDQGFNGDDQAATSAQLHSPSGVAVDGLGNVYIADTFNERIRRVDATTGVITTVAGNGMYGSSGDNLPATSAQLGHPWGMAVDGLGNLYIADYDNQRIRRVDATSGFITTVAGDGTFGFSGDNGAATGAQLSQPSGVAVDALGNLYIADRANNRIRRVDASTRIITTVAGTGTAGFSGDGVATSAELNDIIGVAVDGSGNVYIADSGNNRIRRVSTGAITTVAGTGALGFSGDGGAAIRAAINFPVGVAVDGLGNVVVADTVNGVVRRLDATTAKITTVAGRVEPVGMGPVARAQFADPRALVVTPSFALVAGGNTGTVQEMRSGRVEAVAGRYLHTPATLNLARFGDQSFGAVGGVAYDAAAGVIYLTESTANQLHVVTIVDPSDANTWTIAPLNTDTSGGFADGAVATARFRGPTGLYFDSIAHVLYVADTGNHVIRAIDSNGIVTTVAGTPHTLGYFGDGGAAVNALLYRPQALTRCGNGDLFIADTDNERVRRIAADGTITTVLGDGTAVSSGEGRPAATFPVDAPLGLACDDIGNLFVTSTNAVRMVLADDAGVVDGSGSVRTIYGAPPRDVFPSSLTRCLTGLAIVDTTHVRVTDSCAGILVELQRQIAP